MGRRSRRRGDAPAPPPQPRRADSRHKRPPAPWGSFPLGELLVLMALILGIAGLVVWGRRGQAMVVTAAVLGSLAGLELAAREHFAGYRSHSGILAGVITVGVLALLFYAVPGSALAPGLRGAIGAAVFAFGFLGFREAFKRRSGRAGFR